MTYQESIPVAKQLAEKELAKGFDVEAFLILSFINQLDVIPESNVDNHISDIGQMFVDYYYNPTNDALYKLLNSFSKAISEIYHTLNTQEQQHLFKQEIQRLGTMFNT